MKDLESAVKAVNAAISEEEARLRIIAEAEEASPTMVEGNTSAGYYAQIMVAPKEAANIMLRHNYPIWKILGEDAPQEMWDEIARLVGLEEVLAVDI